MRPLCTGRWVEVRSKDEILATLDKDGLLDGMPFMPEMLPYCGRRFRVGAVAHKTCDTATKTGGRRLDSAVHLEDLRCDGSAHGGCQAECRFFWKAAWLRSGTGASVNRVASASPAADGCTEERLRGAARTDEPSADGSPTYVCQATRLPRYTRPLAWWDVRQYVRDVTSGNHSLPHVLQVLLLAGFRKLLSLPFGYRVFEGFYNRAHLLITGRPSPYVDGAITDQKSIPDATLDLQPGELVRVKPMAVIAKTLGVNGKHRGLYYGPEMSPYCGRTFTVRQRVTQIIDESTGRMISMKRPCITLNGVFCAAQYSDFRLLCPRAITPYWRELWLERVNPETRRD